MAGLLKYGLHNDLLSSDSEDTDYNPEDSFPSSDIESDSDDVAGPRKIKQKLIMEEKKIKREKNDLFASSDSSDSDYLPVPRSRKKKKKVAKKKMKREKNESDYMPDPNRISTRGAESKRIRKENSYPKHLFPPHNNTWSSLPTEILQLIFSHILCFHKGVRYLCRCGQVCRNWSTIISQSISWQGTVDLSFLGGEKAANDPLLVRLSQTILGEVKGLNLRGWEYVTSVGVDSIADYCQHLEYLNLSNCQRKVSKIHGRNIRELAEKTNLKRVDFSNLRICSGYVPSLVHFIKVRGEHLTHLNLSENISLGSAIFTTVCEHCPNLIMLNLSNTCVRRVSFLSLQRICNKLQELYLANLTPEIMSDDNNNDNNSEIRGFPHLKVLSVAKLSAVSWLSDQMLQSILKTSHELCTLDIRGNRSITDDGLDIPSHKVERLFISRTNISLRTIEVICHRWKDVMWDLDLSWADAYGTQFDVLLNHLTAGVEPCKKIRNLNLAGTAVTDVGVETVLSNCSVLECLDLTSCRGVARGNKRCHEGATALERLRNWYQRVHSNNA